MKLKIALLATIQMVSIFGLAAELKLTTNSQIQGCRKNVTVGRNTLSSQYALLDINTGAQSLYEMKGADLLNQPNHCSFIIPEETCQNPALTTTTGELNANLTLTSKGEVLTDDQMTYARFAVENSSNSAGFDLEMNCTASVNTLNQKLGNMLSIEVIK